MTPFLVAVAGGLATVVVVAVVLVLLVRRFRRGTGWDEWRAESRALPRPVRRTIGRTTQRGEPAPVEHAGSAARYGRALLANRARVLAAMRRPAVRRGAGVFVVLGAVLLVFYGLEVGRGRADATTWLSIAGWVPLTGLYVQIARGRPVGFGGTEKIERAVRLNEEAAARAVDR